MSIYVNLPSSANVSGYGLYPNQTTIHIGDVNFGMLNAAPATTNYISPYSFPMPAGKIFVEYLCKVTAPFSNGGTVDFVLADFFTLDTADIYPVIYPIPNSTVVNLLLNAFKFTVGGFSVVNPKNWIRGNVEIYVTIADSPI